MASEERELKQDTYVSRQANRFDFVRGDVVFTIDSPSDRHADELEEWVRGTTSPQRSSEVLEQIDVLDTRGFVAARLSAEGMPPGYVERHNRTLRYLGSYERSDRSASDMLRALFTSRVVVIGIGGVGSWIAGTLLTAGVGTIVGVDGDVVERSNLNRTYGYSEADLGRFKTDVFEALAKEHFPDQQFLKHQQWITGPQDVADVAVGADFVVSAADTPHRLIREWVRQGASAAGALVIETMGGRIGPIRGEGAVPFDLAVPVQPAPAGAHPRTLPNLAAESRGPGAPVFHPLADAVGICQALFDEISGCRRSPLRDGYLRKSRLVSVATYHDLTDASEGR